MSYKYFLIFDDFEKIQADDRVFFNSEKTVNNVAIFVHSSNTHHMQTLSLSTKILIEYDGVYVDCKNVVTRTLDDKYLTIVFKNQLIFGVLQDD